MEGRSLLRAGSRPRVSVRRGDTRWRRRTSPAFLAFRALTRAEEKTAFEQFIDFVQRAAARLSGPARLPLRALRDVGPEAADERARHSRRTSSTTCCAARCSSISTRSCGSRCASRTTAIRSRRSARSSWHGARASGHASPDGGDSILQFERWRTSGDAAILEAIERLQRRGLRLHARTARLAARPAA